MQNKPQRPVRFFPCTCDTRDETLAALGARCDYHYADGRKCSLPAVIRYPTVCSYRCAHHLPPCDSAPALLPKGNPGE